ncbi:hypothetical protein SO802_025448 [Lithocarpus litseifolius]|uniref:Trafficking protein particle complex subunit 2 n=1 Tax=Lithocarpus litseifolius TaxID=425828 RepID=A0AAW2BYD8_9ROSI
MATTACFIIVSRNDIPIYEAEVGSATKREDAAQLHQFILHAALDIVQDLAWTTSAMFLKAIDRFNDLVVSVYVTAGDVEIVLMLQCPVARELWNLVFALWGLVGELGRVVDVAMPRCKRIVEFDFCSLGFGR